MMRSIPLCLLALALLAGCRDTLTGPDPIGPPPGDPPPATSSDMYVKGPPELAVGETATYRAELIEETTGYRWAFAGEGNATSLDGSSQREFTLTAITPGYLIVNFRAYGPGGAVVGYAEKLVQIY